MAEPVGEDVAPPEAVIVGDAEGASGEAVACSEPLATSKPMADSNEADGWAVLEDFLGACVDSFVRGVMVQESYIDAIEDRDPAIDAHVAWLKGLLDRTPDVPQATAGDVSLVRGVRQWLGMLEDIAELVTASGRSVEGDGTPTWDRH